MFREAWNYLDGMWTKWKLEIATPRNSKKYLVGDFRQPPGGGSNWRDRQWFGLVPGNIYIDTRLPTCEEILDGLAAEIIEIYAVYGPPDRSKSSPHYGATSPAHDFAEPFRGPTSEACCECNLSPVQAEAARQAIQLK